VANRPNEDAHPVNIPADEILFLIFSFPLHTYDVYFFGTQVPSLEQAPTIVLLAI
jgi:hypothetical protein